MKTMKDKAPVCVESRTEHRDGFQIFSRRDLPAGEILDGLLPDPDRIIAEGKIYKEGTRNHSVRIELAGRYYFLKRYNCRGWCYRVGNVFRQSRAVRTWLAHLYFYNLGLPIQEPIFCLEERNFRLLGRSYLLTGFVAASVSLINIWPDLNADQKTSLLKELAGHLGTMHRAGGVHGDLKWYNILIRPTESGLKPFLVDLDGSRVLGKPSRRKAREDIERFLRDLGKYEEDPLLRDLFLDAWSSQVDVK